MLFQSNIVPYYRDIVRKKTPLDNLPTYTRRYCYALSILHDSPKSNKGNKKGMFMNFLDFAVVAIGSMIIMMVFVVKTDIEKSRVRVKVKVRK